MKYQKINNFLWKVTYKNKSLYGCWNDISEKIKEIYEN